MYILIAILVFGFLIFIHELGHYIAARLCHVHIHEFSIGMGPKLVWYTSKKTGIVYALRMFPIGGFVSMLGENPDEDDNRPRPETMPDGAPFDPSTSLSAKPAWQRFIVNVAGASMNLLLGFLVMAILTVFSTLGTNHVNGFYRDKDTPDQPSISETQGLMRGDEILAVNGEKVHIPDELFYEMTMQGTEPMDLLVRRGDDTLHITLTLPTEVDEQSGIKYAVPDFFVTPIEHKTVGVVAKQAFYKCVWVVEMIWESLFDLVSGKYTVDALSGPVGTAGAISDAAKDGWETFALMVVVISVNLGIFNLLPLPALDGGHLLLILIEMVTRKKVSPK
ncbi:MAG: site-2 protease family protein, partial [Clostridia bacterium]|nr:site-2 protease family protein [Clostridia bacterium]